MKAQTQFRPGNDSHALDLAKVKQLMTAIAVVALLGQIYLDATLNNVVCNLMALGSFLAVVWVVFRPATRMGGAYLTAAAIFLNISSNSIVPMIGTLLQGDSLVAELRMPNQVFTHRLIFAFILILSHLAASGEWAGTMKRKFGRGFDTLSVRERLPVKAILLIGLFGMCLVIVRRFLPPGVMEKTIAGFAFTATAPFVLLAPPFLRETLKNKPRIVVLVLLYITLATVGVTSRMSFVLPFGVVGTAGLVAFLAGSCRLPRLQLPLVVFGGIGAFILMSGMIRMSDAILIERAHRSQRSLFENISATVNRFMDPDSILAAKMGKEQERDKLERLYPELWEENYIRNPLFSRFTAIKYDDNGFWYSRNFNATEVSGVRNVTRDKILALLPTPILRIFEVEVDKEWVNSFSIGDYFYSMGSSVGVLGSLVTGSMTAHAWVAYGKWYPVIFGPIFFVLFFLFQCLAIAPRRVGIRPAVSTFAQLYAFTFYLNFAVEGIHITAGQLIRGLWQTLLLYGLLLWALKYIFGINYYQLRRSAEASNQAKLTSVKQRQVTKV